MSILKEIASDYMIFRDDLIKSTDFDDSILRGGTSIYEVVRVINRKLLFFDDHIVRFYKSLEIAGYSTLYTKKDIKDKLDKLIENNSIKEGNIKYLFNINNNVATLLVYFMKHVYPSEEQYEKGVSAGVYNAVRENPNAKVWNGDLRESVSDYKIKKGYFEVIYQDKNGFLTEGSMSTFFLIKNNKVYTAPAEMVLEGVTRKYVLEVCKELNIEVIEEAISADELSTLDAAFISGTSPKVLPINSIDDNNYDICNNVLRRIMKRFDEVIIKSTSLF